MRYATVSTAAPLATGIECDFLPLVFGTAISLAKLDLCDDEGGAQGSSEICPKTTWVDWDHFSKALERHKAFQEYLTKLNHNMDEHKRNAVKGNY